MPIRAAAGNYLPKSKLGGASPKVQPPTGNHQLKRKDRLTHFSMLALGSFMRGLP